MIRLCGIVGVIVIGIVALSAFWLARQFASSRTKSQDPKIIDVEVKPGSSKSERVEDHYRERRRILEMVHSGQIGIDEAETLLKLLETK
ncbi:MAG: hypothetical protein WC975_05495 [Phycisphaerae bacterium]